MAAAGGTLGGVGYYAIQTAMNPCVEWNWGEAAFWGGVGTGLGALLGTGIYGGWWVGLQFGWWGPAVAGSGTVAAQQAATRGGAGPVCIGQAGVRHVVNLLRRAGEPIIRQQAYYRTSMGRAFIDIETQNFLIEVKNLANPSLSSSFREQAQKYLEISQQIGKPLQYYFTNRPPSESIIRFLRRLEILWFHIPIR